jgi:hypothetical protein
MKPDAYITLGILYPQNRIMKNVPRVPGPEWQSSFLDTNRFYVDIGLHVILAIFALSPFALLLVRRRSPAGWLDLWLLLVCAVIFPFALSYLGAQLPDYTAPFVIGYTILAEIVLVLSLLMIAWRLKKQSKGRFAFNILASLLALGLVIGLCLPAVPSNAIRQVAVALIDTRSTIHDLSQLPPNNAVKADGTPAISWRVKLLPWLEQKQLYEKYEPNFAWDTKENRNVAQTQVATYTCPSEPNFVSPDGGRYTSFAMLENSDLSANNPKRLPVSRKSDDQQNRILLIESCGSNIVWTEPRDIDVDTMDCSILPYNRDSYRTPWRSKGIGSSYHGSGVSVTFADGSTRFLPASIDRTLLQKMIHGEPWPMSEFD